MNITTRKTSGKVPVTILCLHGDLDGSTYTMLIQRATELHKEGMRDLLVDMSGVSYMSSAGIVALHNIALLLRGDKPADPEQGWAALHAIAQEESTTQQHIQLLNPQPRVDRALELAGLKEFFRIHSDVDRALAAF